MSENPDRTIGRLEGKIEAMNEQINTMQRDVAEMREYMLKAKGGWMTLVMLASVAASVGAFAAKFVPYMFPLR